MMVFLISKKQVVSQCGSNDSRPLEFLMTCHRISNMQATWQENLSSGFHPGASCSKLMTSLVNVSLKFQT